MENRIICAPHKLYLFYLCYIAYENEFVFFLVCLAFSQLPGQAEGKQGCKESKRESELGSISWSRHLKVRPQRRTRLFSLTTQNEGTNKNLNGLDARTSLFMQVIFCSVRTNKDLHRMRLN